MRIKGLRDILLFALMGVVGIVMFFYVIVYKLENPSLIINANPSPATTMKERAKEMRERIAGFMMRLKKDPNDLEALENLGSIFLQMGAWDKACFFFERALKIKGGDADIEWDLATCYFYMKKYAKASSMLEDVVKERKQDYAARFNLALIYGFYLHRKKEALTILRGLLEDKRTPSDIKKQAEEKLRSLEHK